MDQPHTEDCPGCRDDLLTEEDLARLPGYRPRPHTYVAPPRLAPPPPPRLRDSARVALLLAGATLTPVLPTAFAGPEVFWYTAPTLVGAVGWYVWRHHARHRPPRPRCALCRGDARREAARQWADYHRLVDLQRQRWHAQNYHRLLAEEQRYREDPPPA